MNHFFYKKAVVAICFVIVICTGFALNIRSLEVNFEPNMSIAENIANIENAVNEQTIGKFEFINFFGYLQRLLGKNEINNFEVVKDEQGFLHYTFFASGPKISDELVENLCEFRDGIQNKKTNFLYVMSPDKNIPGYTSFAKGIPNSYSNETADLFLESLEKQNINYVDIRKELFPSDVELGQLFYRTDHHWKVETAFGAFDKLIRKLNNMYGWNLKKLDKVTNLENYNKITYKNSYLGSMGRKNGVAYSGVDDFTLIYPKFDTDYVYCMKNGDLEMKTSGKFDQALLSMKPFRFSGSQYEAMADKYSSYLYGNHGVAHIKNNQVNGPKIAIVKDSFMVPVASFLSTVCSDIYLLDTRYYDESILEYINNKKDLDCVIVSYNPQDLTEDFFVFDK